MAKLLSALGGAGSGAAAGTAVLPGIGTAIGAGVGGLLGFFGGGDDPASNPITNPVDAAQLQAAQGQTTQALAQQQAFLQALQGQNGIGNQSSVFNQLQGVANGTGPNPAQAMLNQTTGANVANQAALMAGQRGASANTGLIARQAAQQGSNIQQQAAGQAATLQANQSLGALGQLGGIAGQQVAQQQNAVTGLNQFAQNHQNQLLNAQSAYNSALNGQGSNQNVANQQNNNMIGGLLGGAGAAIGALTRRSAANPMGSSGGAVAAGGPSLGVNTTFDQPKFASGGAVNSPSSFVGRHLKGIPMMAEGGQVEALVSPGERYLPPSEVKKVQEGKKAPMAAGEKIPGKAKVSGATNSYANDTVDKKLQSGGIILPRSVTQSEHPNDAAAKFVQAILARKGA